MNEGACVLRRGKYSKGAQLEMETYNQDDV
jgi:hypothetical protein